jgi:hypothetical protein
MTLIASFQRHPEGIFTVSDVMLSVDRPRPKLSIDFPLRRQDFLRPSDGFRSAETNTSPVGMAQKMVILDPNGMALWAGSRAVAYAIFKDLAGAYALGQRPSLEEVIQSSGVLRREADQVAIIAFLDHGDSIVQQVLHTERLERSFGSIVYAGTGSYPGILDIEEGALGGGLADLRKGYLNRLMMTLFGELITQDNADFSFGGWFELGQSGVGGTFSKIPYTVKLWLVDKDQVFNGPALVSGYVEHDLIVFYLNQNAPAARLPYLVPDFLRRSGRTSWHGESPDQEHALEFHVIHFNDLKRTAFLSLAGPQRAITMEVRRGALAWGVDPEFLKRLIRETRDGRPPGVRLSRLSTWS